MDRIQVLVEELTSGDDDRAESAVHQLAKLGSQAIPALKSLLSSDQIDSRWWGVRALAEVNDPAVPPLIMNALHDPDRRVRECAAVGLRRQPDPAAIPLLIECIQKEEGELSRLAADALVSIGAEAVPELINVLKNGPQMSRLAAIRALAYIGDPRSIPALFEALSQDSALLEYWGNEGLDKMGVGMKFFKT